jgi:uncharacterized protein (TIGR02678 family)
MTTADLHAEAEVRAAARALMRTPLLYDGGGHDDDLRLVRRHRAELTRLFADGLGYRLVVEPGVARLVKTGLGRDSTRGLRRRSGAPFTPRAYAMLALTVAALTRSRAQLMVDELVAQVRSAAADAGVEVDLDAVADRRSLHAALLTLTDLGVLSERDGDLEHWAERRTESLLDVHRERLALLVSAPLGGCRTADDVVAVTAVPSAVGGARVAVRRRLAEQPVLTTDDLAAEHREWWARNRNREREWFRRALGLEVELRAEGAVAIDPDGWLTDLAFPGGGSTRHFALLLLDGLVAEIRAVHGSTQGSQPWAPVALSSVRRIGDEVFRTWREGFRKAHREDPDGLLGEALDVLGQAGLLRRDGSTVLVHAASARYAPRPLFDEKSP